MDVLLPEDPQENNTSTPTAMEGEATTENSLNHGTSQEGQQKDIKKGDNGGNGKGEVGGEVGAEVKQPEGDGSGEAAATGSAQAGKGKHASGRKPRTKGLIKKLQEQVIIK